MTQFAMFSPEQARVLWQDYLQRQQTDQNNTRNREPIYPPAVFQWAVLNASIAAASNAATTPASATAELVIKNGDGDLLLSGETITVFNRFESISLAADTLCMVMKMRGEWHLAAADCAPLVAATITSMTPA